MTKNICNDKNIYYNIIEVLKMNKIENPFTISFGVEPYNVILRNTDLNDIINIFSSQNPQSKTLTITGPRGSGKTVLLSQTKKYFDNLDNWICVDLNPNDDMLEQLAALIFDKGKIKHLFLKAEFNFSFSGFGITITGSEPVSNVYALLDKMLAYLKKKDIRLLILVDDVSNNEYMKKFIPAYQNIIRNEYQAFLLMTGLYENIYKLERSDNLTFLARTPKIQLGLLNLRSITYEYMKIFNIDMDNALELAKTTNGYAYAFQLLGSILYNDGKTKIDDEILRKYDILLEDNSYSLIWESLSTNEKKILLSIASSNEIKDIINDTNMSNSSIQVYKKNLEKAGLIDTQTRGQINFVLPRFKEFVQFKKKLLEN